MLSLSGAFKLLWLEDFCITFKEHFYINYFQKSMKHEATMSCTKNLCSKVLCAFFFFFCDSCEYTSRKFQWISKFIVGGSFKGSWKKKNNMYLFMLLDCNNHTNWNHVQKIIITLYSFCAYKVFFYGIS